MSKTKCPSCGAVSIRSGATKCPSCQAWVQPPRFTKRRLRLSPLGVVAFTVGLCITGMISGVVAVVTAQGKRPTPRMVEPPENPEVSVSPSASAAATTSVLPNGTGSSPVVDPPAVEGKFGKTVQVRLDAPPADILFSADDALLYVLAEDGTLRAHDATSGAEKRRVKLPGRGKSLKALPGGRVAVLGLPADLVVMDEAAWAEGKPEANFSKRIAMRDVLDLVAIGEPPSFIALTGQGSRVQRLSSDFSKVELEFVSAQAVQTLATIRVGQTDRLVMLVGARPPADTGSVMVTDPASESFGASRAVWSGVVDPHVSQRVGSDKLVLFDSATATVIDYSMGSGRRVAPAGPQPIAAFRWVGDRAVVIGAAGSATLVSFSRHEVETTVALGAVPSAAVGTPDRRVVIVALGGGLRGRGAKTVVLGGEPLAIESTIETGDGSHVLAMGSKGSVVAVGAVAGRSITLLVRK